MRINDASSDMKDELIQNMKEESEHIPLWEKFAGSMGISCEQDVRNRIIEMLKPKMYLLGIIPGNLFGY